MHTTIHGAAVLLAALAGLVPAWSQNLNDALDLAGQSFDWSGPPGAIISSEGGAAVGASFVRLISASDPTQSGWLTLDITGPGWVDFQFRPVNNTVLTTVGEFALWPYRANSIAGQQWNQGGVFLAPGQNRLVWAAQPYLGVTGPAVVDVDDVQVRPIPELTLTDALSEGGQRDWRTSAERPWTGMAFAPSAWFLPGVLEFRPPCGWVRVTPSHPSAWVETMFNGPGRLNALSAVVPWADNWTYGFGVMVATLDGAPIAVWRHSLNNVALEDFLIPPGQHVVRWTVNHSDVPDLANHVADAQLGQVIFESRQEISLDDALGSSGWRTRPENPWFGIQEEGTGAISGPRPGQGPSWIEKEFTGPAILTFIVTRANLWTLDAPRELSINVDGQDLPMPGPGFGIVPGGYSLVLPPGSHPIRWTTTTDGGLVAMKNVATIEKPDIWLAEALGIPGALVMTGNTISEDTGGWQPVADGYQGAPAVRSGNVSIQTWLQTWVDGPAVVSFWSRFEGDADSSSSFYVDEVATPAAVTGDPPNHGWQQTRLMLTRGRHLLRWSATYDGIGSGYYVSRLKISPNKSYEWGRKFGR